MICLTSMAKEASNQSAKRPASGAKGKKKVFLRSPFVLRDFSFHTFSEPLEMVQRENQRQIGQRRFVRKGCL